MNRYRIATALLVPALALATACSAGDETEFMGTNDYPSPSADDDGMDEEPMDDEGDEDPQPEPEPEPADHSDEIDDYILSLGHLDITPIADAHAIPCDPTTMDCVEPWENGDQICEQVYYEQTDHHDRFLALQPDAPLLWPGALVRGSEIEDGFLSAIGLERAPATFSLSLENLNNAPAATMDLPSLSAFREARAEILDLGVSGATPAQMSYEIYSVNSRSELSILIGASVDWESVVDFDALFSFDDDEFQNRYLFDFTQTYYTADLDTPARPSSLFDEVVTAEDVADYSGPNDPPMYVQSVVFGRRVLFAIESNDSLTEIIAAVDAAFGGAAALDADIASTETLSAAKITAGILGGDAGAAVMSVLGPEHLIEFITEGGDYSKDSPGVPIAYRLAYLDNTTARLALTAQYPEVECN